MTPKLYLIGSPRFRAKEFHNFLKNERLTWEQKGRATQASRLVEVSGRVCYLAFGGLQSERTNEQYIRNLIENEHESVLEHANWTFLLTDVSRAFTHQLVRHRVGFSYSQLSQQYHDETDAKFIEPALLKNDPAARKIWRHAIAESKRAYALIARREFLRMGRGHKLPKEEQRALRSAARSVLPNATETKIMISANARSLRYFLKVRGAILGDLEMREVSALILKTMQKEAPNLFVDFEIRIHTDGFPIVLHSKQKSF